jgi:Flp pilus assembly protein TadD
MRSVLWVLLMHLAVVSVWADEPVVVQFVDQGEQLLAEGQLGPAIEAYEKAMTAGAGSALFLNRLGSMYLRAERFGRAAATFRLSIAEKPGQLPVYSKIGEAFLAAGELDSAIHYVQEARLIAPEASSVHSSLAFLLLQREAGEDDLRHARAHLDTALQLDATNAEAYRYLGFFYTQADSLELAENAYVRITELVPDHFEAYNNLGFLHLMMEDPEGALRYYEQAKERVAEPYLVYAINERMEAARAVIQGKMRARFILVRTREEAAALLARINNGEDMGQLAKEHSLAPNADSGGDTDYFGAGELLPEFEQAVLGMDVGALGDVVELEMGFLIIQRLN